MNCPSCGVKLASISKFCPECGAKLTSQEEKKNISESQTIEALLANIVQNYGGPELYKEENARKLAGLLKDFSGFKFQDEVKLLSRVVPEGFQEVLYNANNSSPEEKQGALAACKMKLIDNLYFSEAKAVEATNILAAGLCWNASQKKNTSNDKGSSDIKTSSQNECKQKSGIVQKELLSKGIILNNDSSRIFQTLGEAVKIAENGSEIKLGPGIYIEPENSPLTEITKKITITGCTENIANKDFSELPIVVLNKENSCKITSDAVIEGVVFASDESIHFKTLNDYLSKAPESFDSKRAIPYERHDTKLLAIDKDDFYSLLLVEGNAELKNIAVLASEKYGVTFISEKGCITDSVVALSSCVNILCSKNTKAVIKRSLCAFSLSTGIFLEGNSEQEISECSIHDNKRGGIAVYNSSKPKISHCKIYNNSSYGVNTFDTSESEITSCEIYGNTEYGIYTSEYTKDKISDCKIYDTKEDKYEQHFSVGVEFNSYSELKSCEIYGNGYGVSVMITNPDSKTLISQCIIHDNKIFGILTGFSNPVISDCIIYKNEKGIQAGFGANPKISSCNIYENRETGIEIIAQGTYSDCDVHDNNGCGIKISNVSNTADKPKISNCKIHDNKENGIHIECSNAIISDCKIYGNKLRGIYDWNAKPKIISCEIDNP